jgi:hypothetical protein
VDAARLRSFRGFRDGEDQMNPMRPCTVTSGFFMLRNCGRPGVDLCRQCGRALCAEHVGAGGWCPECSSAQWYDQRNPYHPGWTRGYRRDYYRRSAQTYNDTTWYSGFDSYDRSAFDPGNDYSSGGDDWGDGDGPDLVDS